jgi:hypothetical protein
MKPNDSHAQPELEIELPDLDRWWFVLQIRPPGELSTEEIAARREAVELRILQDLFQDFDLYRKEERQIMKRLESPACGEGQRKQLGNYLQSIRTYLRTTRALIDGWGLVRPQAA